MAFRYYFNYCEIVLLVSALAVTNNISPPLPINTHLPVTFATMLDVFGLLKRRSNLYYALSVWTDVNYLRLQLIDK